MSVSTEPVDAGPALRQRFPDFFIVGHHKSGTSALYEMLRRHPQIFMPDLKEPRFLASDMRSRFRFRGEPRHPETLAEYLALFTPAAPDQRVGEASATYLWSHTAAERIAEVQPRARIIAIFREPASFLYSLHLTFVRGRVETKKTLRQAMALEQRRAQGKSVPRRSHLPQLLQYSDHVRYVEQLRRYHARLPREQVLTLIYDDFRADNEGTVRRVLEFLEVDDQQSIEALDTNVTNRTVRSQQLAEAMHSVSFGVGPISRSTKAAVKAVTTRRLRRDALSLLRHRVVQADPPPPDERFMLELRRRFKPEVAGLSEYLNRDLVTLWGYDGIA